ncbi:MAG TPA: NADH-quinone oxidoreductase subunit NuoN, partial [Burkholderiaceae bacterium]|nr:NADH-quinone oxidoreductase subunit NuoN [Burkholderiaceae bacterium]
SDELARLLKVCAYVATAVTLLYARVYIAQRQMYRGEFYTLALFALLGQMVMISSNNLLVTYLGLELMSLALYALAALRRDSGRATEAAIKYFVLGALASGFLLYGMSMVYGGTGSLDLPDIARALSTGQANRTVMVFGVVFIVAGLAFKFGAVPFHMWVPDVYQGTPTAVTLLIAGAPKLAAFALAFRVLAEGLIGVAADWQQMLTVLCVASLVVGNLIAIAQTNFKRMLAYSTIAQVGFVLLGLLSGVIGGDPKAAPEAYSASLFYIITYVLTTLGTFGLIQLMARQGFEAEEISDLRGLNRRSPWMAFVALILMFSLAGIPPTVGFYAKLVVLQAVVHADMVWLAVLAVVASLVGAFYYLRIVKTLYFDEPTDTNQLVSGPSARAAMGVNGALVLLLGVLPSPLLTACIVAIRQALTT